METGSFDLQVNGYGGVDFNSAELTGEELHRACELLDHHDVSAILATIITDQIPAMCGMLQNLVRLREADPLARRIIAGIHIEGPFLNEAAGFRGAHPPDAILPADEESMRRLLDAANGLTRLVTLAPERDERYRVTQFLAAQNIRVSAGHTDASLDQLLAAIDAGLTLFTHLGNGCPMQMHRHDNIIQRSLSLSDKLWLCFIADGVHVPWPALRNYLKAAGIERSVVVTDCISAAGLGPGRYRMGRWDLLIGEDGVARSPDGSHFVGSAGTMPQTKQNLEIHLGLNHTEIHRLTCDNPPHRAWSLIEMRCLFAAIFHIRDVRLPDRR